MADYYTLFSCHFDVGTAENALAAQHIFEQMATDLEEDDDLTIGFEISFSADHPGNLWIHDVDNYGEPEHVIAFVLRCAEAFDLKGRWGFTWALTCSRQRVEGFGGGAQVIDLGARKSIGWVDCDHWLAVLLEPTAEPSDGAVAS